LKVIELLNEKLREELFAIFLFFLFSLYLTLDKEKLVIITTKS